ncbi:hypothetical protein ACIGG9_28580 [Pseudonocardia alni]|uniref:hypothetical protein n=1 Tax=Pseudonocardia alni TaxID=33907 RepID=UPI0033EBA100
MVVSLGPPGVGIDVDPTELVVYAKTLRGVLFGNLNPTGDVPRLLEHYRSGHLRLDDLVTATYRVDEVAQAYADLHAGRILRGVLRHEH